MKFALKMTILPPGKDITQAAVDESVMRMLTPMFS